MSGTSGEMKRRSTVRMRQTDIGTKTKQQFDKRAIPFPRRKHQRRKSIQAEGVEIIPLSNEISCGVNISV